MKGTHNSATGLPSNGMLSWLVIPFARCQTKTLVEQYKAGCRYFDFRVRYTKRGWVFAHGLWESSGNVDYYLMELYAAIKDDDLVYCHICYEGHAPVCFQVQAERWKASYGDKLRVSYLAEKKPEWTTLKFYEPVVTACGYEKLVWPNIKMLLPIPWLWNKMLGIILVDDKSYLLVDFL